MFGERGYIIIKKAIENEIQKNFAIPKISRSSLESVINAAKQSTEMDLEPPYFN